MAIGVVTISLIAVLAVAFGAVLAIMLGLVPRDPRDALAERIRAGTATLAAIGSVKLAERLAVLTRRKA